MKPPNHNYDEIETEFRFLNGVIAEKNPNKSDIELITIQPNSYTSLRDIIAASSAISGAGDYPMNFPASPTCLNDVSIRNPLVKQAAMAYLQPQSSPRPGLDGRSWPERVKANLNSCFAGDGEGDEIGCLGPLDGVVLAPIKEFLGRVVKAFWTAEIREDDHRD